MPQLYTSLSSRVPTKPGLEVAGGVTHTLVTDWNEGQFGYLPENWISGAESWKVLMNIGLHAGGGLNDTAASGNSGPYAITVDGSTGGTIGARWANDGIRLVNGTSASDNDVSIAGNMLTGTAAASNIIASGDTYKGVLRAYLSNASSVGAAFGLVTSSATDVIGSNPADGVFFLKATGAATAIGRVVENSQTGDDTGTLLTNTALTEFTLAFEFTVGTTAATCSGNWWVNGTKTAFTNDQLTAVATMLNTTAASLRPILQMRSSDSTARNLTAAYAWVGQKRTS